MNLVIVESPSKKEKIQGFLGEGWNVEASFGHIRELKKNELSILKKADFLLDYVISENKMHVVNKLKSKVRECGKNNIYLATDDDREGEAISYHLATVLELNIETTKRITFREITSKAVLQAVQSPRLIDMQLVAAQESRRAVDRLVGYEISPVLCRKVEKGLSAGRVQSVAVRMIVDRENEINSFGTSFKFQVKGQFLTAKNELITATKIKPFSDLESAKAYLESAKLKSYSIYEIETTPIEKKPKGAYSTSLLQQDGIKKLKLSVDQITSISQKLFEAGHVTYIRTDSVNLADEAIDELQKHITSDYGKDYFTARKFKNKDSAQEAHEAIRPTHWEIKEAGDNDIEKKVYHLIYKRAMASQMSAAQFDKTTITIKSDLPDDIFTSSTKIMTFEGYLKVYEEDPEEDEDSLGEDNEGLILKAPLFKGDQLAQHYLTASQVYSEPAKRYNQATLIAELEKKQIGRPSTYNPTISNIFARSYVEFVKESIPGKKFQSVQLELIGSKISSTTKEIEIGSLKVKMNQKQEATTPIIPTRTGIMIVSFLMENFPEIIDYKFTAVCEGIFDKIAKGKLTYKEFLPQFDQKLTVSLLQVNDRLADITEGKEIGQWNNQPVKTGSGKFGTYVFYNDEYFNVKEIKAEDITLPLAIKIISEGKENKIRTVGKLFHKDIKCGKGKKGTFLLWDDRYFQANGFEPATIKENQAVELIQLEMEVLKKKETAKNNEKIIKVGKKHEIRQGEFKWYVTDGTTNAFINFKNITEEDLQKWTEDQCKSHIKKFKDWKKKEGKK